MVQPTTTSLYFHNRHNHCAFCAFLFQYVFKVGHVCFVFHRLEKEILDRYLEVVLKGNKDGLKVRSMLNVLHMEIDENRERKKFIIFFNLLIQSNKRSSFQIAVHYSILSWSDMSSTCNTFGEFLKGARRWLSPQVSSVRWRLIYSCSLFMLQ